MRTTLSHWTAIAVVTLSTVSFTGCQSTGGWGWPTQNWLSWNKKAPATSLSAKPSSNFLPSPASTLAGGGGAHAAGGAAAAYPTTGQPSANYGNQQASAAQPGYYTGPYNTGAAAANAAGPAAAARGYPVAGQNASPYGASSAAADGYRTADQRSSYGANPSAAAAGNWSTPPANAPATSWNNSGANNNPASANYSNAPSGYTPPAARPTANPAASPWNTPAAGHEGHDHGTLADNPAARSAAPARDGGYRPGSTGRAKPIDNGWRADEENVQPATFNRTPLNNGAYGEDPAYQPAARPADGGYVPPSGSYQP